MYPTLSDMLFDLFGIRIALPFQTFGLFLTLSFVGAYWLIQKELRRKFAAGLMSSRSITFQQGKAKPITDYVLNGILGTLAGYKFLLLFTDYAAFSANPQEALLSGQGVWWGGLLGLLISIGLTWQDDQKHQKLPKETITREIKPWEELGTITGYAAIGGILGAKIFHNFENWDEFMADPIAGLISFSGLTFYGGLIVAASLIIWHARKIGMPVYHLVDASAPGLMLAYGLGRIGCQLSGDGDWGIVNLSPKPGWLQSFPDWVWSYTYPHNVINQGERMLNCAGEHCYELSQGVFPTPFYETMMALSLTGVLWLIRKKINVPGMLFMIYIVMNGIERFLIEQIRVNTTSDFFGLVVTQAQIISSLMMIGGLTGIFLLWKNKKSPQTPLS